MSLPIAWMFAGHIRANRSASLAYPAAVM